MTGQELKSIRLGMGLTQSELGAKIGVKKSAVSLWESGARKIPSFAIKIVRVLQAVEGNETPLG